jgi:hypothetical protein
MILALFLLLASAPQPDAPTTARESKTTSAKVTGEASPVRKEPAKEFQPEVKPAETLPAAPAEEISFMPGQITLHALVRDAEGPAVSKGMEVQPNAAPASPISPAIRRPFETPSPTQRRTWYALSVVGSGAATFDAWSTRHAITQGYGREMNPTLRPFAHSAGLYAAIQASPLLMDFVGRKMMTSHYRMVRKMWWLPQSASAGVSFASGVHNVRMAP